MTAALLLGALLASRSSASDDLERSVTALASIGGCWSPSFSPDGSQIAFCSNLNGKPQVWIVSSNGGWPQLVTATDDPIHKVSWSPDGSWLAVEVAPGGGENPQVYVIRPNGTGMRQLTQGQGETNWLNVWTRDGKQLAVASNQNDVANMDNFLVDVATGETSRFEAGPGICRTTSFNRDGQLALVWRMHRRGDNDLYLANTTTGEKTHLNPHDGQQRSHGFLDPSGKRLFLGSDWGRDLAAFGHIAIDEMGRPSPIEYLQTRDDAELESWAINAEATLAVLIWAIAGQSELQLLDLTTGDNIPVPKLPRVVAYQPTFSRDGNQIALVSSGAVSPRDIWVLNIEAGRWRQVTHSPHAGVDLSALVRPRLVRFPSHDGLELTGWLYLPPTFAMPGPLVLDFHGGPEAMHWPIMTPLFQSLAANGIAVFAPNVRGSSGFGRQFMSLDDGPRRGDAVQDIKACVDYVVSQQIADPKRIGITGLSYGGYMTMAGLTEYPDQFAAGVMRSGIVNLQTLLENCDPWHAAISKTEYGDPETQTNMLRRLSPIHKIDRVRAPTLVIHGANDTNCPVIEAEQAVASLKENGVTVQYMLISGEGHVFSKKENVVRADVAVVRWFVEHLQRTPR